MLVLRAFNKLLEISEKVSPNFLKSCLLFKNQSISELLGDGKITHCSKSCSKRKKVARNTKSKSNLWKALLVPIQMGINMATGNQQKHWPLSFELSLEELKNRSARRTYVGVTFFLLF